MVTSTEWWVTGIFTVLTAVCAVTSPTTHTAPDVTLEDPSTLTGCEAVCHKHTICELDAEGCYTKCELSTPDPVRCGECWERETCASLLAAGCFAACTEEKVSDAL